MAEDEMIPLAGGDAAIDSNAGEPLPQSLRHELETTLGQTLSDVRVHTQHQQVATLLALGAQAFTHGSNIFFAAGSYQPHTDEGRSLIAHEATHAVQQRAGRLDTPRGMARATRNPRSGQ